MFGKWDTQTDLKEAYRSFISSLVVQAYLKSDRALSAAVVDMRSHDTDYQVVLLGVIKARLEQGIPIAEKLSRFMAEFMQNSGVPNGHVKFMRNGIHRPT